MIKHRQLNKHSNTTIKDTEDLLNGTTEVDETNVGILMENYVKELEKVTETLPENEENRKLRKHRAGKKAGIKSAKGYNKMTSTSNRSERKTGTSNGSGRKRKTVSNGKEEKEKQQKYDLEKLRLEITMKEKEASV